MLQKYKDKITVLIDKARKRGLFAPQSIGLYLIALISISVVYNGSKVIQQNYELNQQVERIEQENLVIELENQNKELKNQYFATDEYADITARSSFGRALPGERVYIVPEEVAERSLVTPPEQNEEPVAEQDIPEYRKNIEAWLNIYFGG